MIRIGGGTASMSPEYLCEAGRVLETYRAGIASGDAQAKTDAAAELHALARRLDQPMVEARVKRALNLGVLITCTLTMATCAVMVGALYLAGVFG